MNTKTAYVALDLETSGLPSEDKKGNKDFTKVCILRVGAIAFAGASEAACFDMVVRPEPGYTIDPKALAINGLSQDDLDKGVSIQDALVLLEDFIGPCLDIVGQNLVAFDLPLLRIWKNRVGLHDDGLQAWDTKAIWTAFSCGLQMQAHEEVNDFMARASAWRSDAKSNLDFLAQVFLGAGEKRTGAHSPIEDARLSANVFEAMRDRGILASVMRGS